MQSAHWTAHTPHKLQTIAGSRRGWQSQVPSHGRDTSYPVKRFSQPNCSSFAAACCSVPRCGCMIFVQSDLHLTGLVGPNLARHNIPTKCAGRAPKTEPRPHHTHVNLAPARSSKLCKSPVAATIACLASAAFRGSGNFGCTPYVLRHERCSRGAGGCKLI